jgi:hypothetical protein
MAKRMSSKSLMLSGLGLVLIVIVVLVIVLVVRHDNKTNKTLSTAQANAAKLQIETNWKNFFAAPTSLQGREKLLQNGTAYADLIQAEFTSLASQASSAVISSVNLPNKTTANVVYTVDLNGQPVLNNEAGQALLINNTWQVSDSTLCHLISLSGTTPAICQSK